MKVSYSFLYYSVALILSFFFHSSMALAEKGVYVGYFEGSIETLIQYSRNSGSDSCSLTVAGAGGLSPVSSEGSVTEETSEDGRKCTFCEVNFSSAIEQTLKVKMNAVCTFALCEESGGEIPWNNQSIVCQVDGVYFTTDLQKIVYVPDQTPSAIVAVK